ncbi:MAG TPA: phosphoenolpyruvate--protein phosphotransferase [Candidatus Limnocylindrales bacterium]|nr:phosphoenolpyruvate--protein phosphotransferase [Candidatus Limnocylindrales bacterium]
MARAALTGRPGSPGVGVGRLLWVAPVAGAGVAEGPAGAATTASGRAAPLDAGAERARLRTALDEAAAELSELADETTARVGEEIGAIFGAQALFATDPGIVDPAMAAIDGGATAAEAIDRITAEQADKLAGVDDDYFRERAADLRDVGRRIVDRLLGRSRPELHHRDGTPSIIASDDLDPSLVAVIRPELVGGIALAGGAPTGHAAIVARALGIPLVLGLGSALDGTFDGLDAAVDGTAGRLLIEPDATELEALRPAPARAAGVASVPDDRAPLPVRLEANVASVREAEAAAEAGADGIGLVRTELLFLGRSSPPGLEEQRSLYRRIARAMAGRPVVFRTLDIGGDKPASYLPGEGEMNPALGVRGLRQSLAMPELFETQLRAFLEAEPDLPLRMMLPMVATVEEVEAARRAIERAAAASRAAGNPVSPEVHLGIMVEIPSVAVMADAFAPVVDFFSIGTNDLVQYTLAADRTNAALAEMATPLQPAILRLIGSVTEAAAARDRPVAVCGEAAADPAAAALLVGLGVDELSVATTSLERVRATLETLDPAACREAASRAIAAAGVGEVRRIAADLLEGGAVRAGSSPG